MNTIRKQFVADEITKDAGAGDRVRRFVVSTSGVDRDNDTIAAAGWKLDNYRKNPTVLWAHDYRSLPLGKALSVDIDGDRLVATAEFADHPMADTVLRMIDGGFLRATSVGFRPMKRVMNEERGGWDFTEQELLEFSVVPVPANPQALIEARDAGIDVSLIKGWAEGVIKGLEAPAPAPSPVVDAALAATKTMQDELSAQLREACARMDTFAKALADIKADFPPSFAALELDDDADVLALDEDDDDLDADEVRAAMRSVITDALGTLVPDLTRTAIHRAFGRVD